PKERVEQCIAKIGIGFLFAPLLHEAMKYAVQPRRDIGIRTIFNILGPLTNPAMATHQLIGIYSGEMVEMIAFVLKNLRSDKSRRAARWPSKRVCYRAGAIRLQTLPPGRIARRQCGSKRGDRRRSVRR
ncbi:MAG: hypothetical protein E6J73_22970, partial [Deltaproteobacteria bacterium]